MSDSNREKQLANLLREAGLYCTPEAEGIRITFVTADSREVQPGCLFVAIVGDSHDGHDYIEEAVTKGCAAVLSEKEPVPPLSDVPVILTADTREVLGYIAAAFYGYPSEEVVMIGITGTNGKTTTAWLIESVLEKAGGVTGVIGTVNIRFKGEEKDSKLTTPEPLELQKILREMVDGGATHVVMEVSSHALEQSRVNGLYFDVAVFTNLSRDHLDYHPDLEGYFDVKKKLFSQYLKDDGIAVVNLETDHPGQAGRWGTDLSVFLNELNRYRVVTCGLEKGDIQAAGPEYGLKGIRAGIVTPEGDFDLDSSLVGEINLRNITGAAGCGFALDLPLETVREGLQFLKVIPGRLERVTPHDHSFSASRQQFSRTAAEEGEGNISKPDGSRDQGDEGPVVFVDYAHTPAALEHVLRALRQLAGGRLIVVFGCGGDRDKGKRPLMGEVAGQLADTVILTSDNPRSEAVEDILADIEGGLLKQLLPKVGIEDLRSVKPAYTVIQDRSRAIKEAVTAGKPGDAVVICGKGHENYQLNKYGTMFFDDRLEAITSLNHLNRN
ncbi:MAG: Mur ligase family protein [Desulfurivibrionaceae bacterium]